mmetsp:Transcript_956/g.1355  ORF Transcript_956/g.1355 Transcript_956/m.1355 type:complete len:107 (+) Transcript_956:610-930(+)
MRAFAGSFFEDWNDWSFQTLYGANTSTSGTDADGEGKHSVADNSTGAVEDTISRFDIHWLNVFPSAVLRRDGHVGFGDCLHYSIPGPTDWWAHFFHSALLDVAALA